MIQNPKTHSGRPAPATPPATGWSWLDRRFLREHGDYLSREAVLLYLFLAAVADRHGLSFYSDHTLSSRLQIPLPAASSRPGRNCSNAT